jgi:hypothetical protein
VVLDVVALLAVVEDDSAIGVGVDPPESVVVFGSDLDRS